MFALKALAPGNGFSKATTPSLRRQRLFLIRFCYRTARRCSAFQEKQGFCSADYSVSDSGFVLDSSSLQPTYNGLSLTTEPFFGSGGDCHPTKEETLPLHSSRFVLPGLRAIHPLFWIGSYLEIKVCTLNRKLFGEL
jgi:hypothetical protein